MDFPVILENGKEVPSVVTKKGLQPNNQKLTGNFTWRDDFDAPKLNFRWVMLRAAYEEWWKITSGKIELEALPRSLRQLVNPAFIACRQQHLNFEASTALNFNPENEKELAGLAYFQNDKNYFVIGKTMKNGKLVMVLQSVADGHVRVISENELSRKLLEKELIVGVSVKEGVASFYCTLKGGKRILLAENVDISNLSTKKAKGFVGSVVGMYATSTGL